MFIQCYMLTDVADPVIRNVAKEVMGDRDDTVLLECPVGFRDEYVLGLVSMLLM